LSQFGQNVARAHAAIVDGTDGYVIVPNLGANALHVLDFQDGTMLQIGSTCLPLLNES
jgi:6-phosphogluconolactonase (cycloisomerase 2 family)